MNQYSLLVSGFFSQPIRTGGESGCREKSRKPWRDECGGNVTAEGVSAGGTITPPISTNHHWLVGYTTKIRFFVLSFKLTGRDKGIAFPARSTVYFVLVENVLNLKSEGKCSYHM